MQTQTVTIINKTGLHTRPGKNFVQLAKKFASSIMVQKEGAEYNAKSLLKIMKSVICQGDEITIAAEGTDEQAAVTELTAYIQGLDPEA